MKIAMILQINNYNNIIILETRIW